MESPKKLLEKYKEVKYINSGTFGSVWKVSNNDGSYAIKSQSYKEDIDGFPGSIMREIDILSRFNHPNIVKLFKIYHGYSNVDIVLSLFEMSLDEWIENNPWTIRAKYIDKIFHDLLDVIYALHENNIFHLDIKPANILIKSTNQISLCDFGLSCIANQDVFEKDIEFCSLHCRPPELLLKLKLERNVQTLQRIDIWSMGCVFLKYIIGYNPFYRNDSIEETVKCILNEEEDLTEKDLVFLELDNNYLYQNQKYKNIRRAWKRVELLAPHWYPLLKSMLKVCSKNRPCTNEVWTIFTKYSDLNQRVKYEKRSSMNIISNSHLTYNILYAITSIISKANAIRILPLAAKLFMRFSSTSKYNRKNGINIAKCCAYLAIKYTYYIYPSLLDIIDPNENAEKILCYEAIILNSFLYRIGE